MKILKKFTACILAAALVLGGFYFFYMRPRYVVPVLMYHAVSEGDGSLYVSTENFTKQMEFLNMRGYKVISLDELVEGISSGRVFDRNTVVITFDDGHEDNFTNAFPVLNRYRIPATIFLVTGYIGVKDGYLNWDQIRVMQEKLVDFGGHTRGHVYLPSISGDTDRLLEEIEGSKEDIEKATGRDVRYFCYPIGGFNDKIKEVVRASGYLGACTTNRGKDRYNKDVYELSRVKVTNSDMTKPFNFRAKLSGYYNLFRRLRPSE